MLPIDLSDRVVLITGASRGIGRAMAETFSLAGADLALNYVSDDEAARTLVSELHATGHEPVVYKGSVADAHFLDHMVKDLLNKRGRIDCLVNNAGITRDIYLAMMRESQWDEVIDVNLKSVFRLTKKVLKPMIARRSGSIINMSSQNAVHGREGQVNYTASKAALLGFTKSLARETGRYNVRVNAIVTGVIDTDMTRRIPGKIMDLLRERIPLGRMGTAREVAHLAAFLASDLASFINGSCVEITGGF